MAGPSSQSTRGSLYGCPFLFRWVYISLIYFLFLFGRRFRPVDETLSQIQLEKQIREKHMPPMKKGSPKTAFSQTSLVTKHHAR